MGDPLYRFASKLFLRVVTADYFAVTGIDYFLLIMAAKFGAPDPDLIINLTFGVIYYFLLNSVSNSCFGFFVELGDGNYVLCFFILLLVS